jgi:hypothetical protein
MSDSLVVGGPGVLAAWVHSLVREAAGLTTNAPEIRVLDRQDDTEFLGDDDASPDRIFLCNFPSPSLIAKVAAGAVPTLALLDEPSDMVRFVRQQSNQSFEDVLRVCALSQTINRALHNNESVLIIHRGIEIDPGELIDLVVQSLNLRLDDEVLRALKQRLTEQGTATSLEDMLSRSVSGWTPQTEIASHLTPEQAATVSQALAPLVHFAFDDRPPSVVWPPRIFLSADMPDQPLPVVLELTGGARTLFYGPYLYLPPGYYRVSFVVGFSQHVRQMPFVMKATQLYGQSTLAQARWVAPGGGIFEGSFTMKHLLSNETIELVLRNDEGAIAGRIALVQISFDLIADQTQEEVEIFLETSPYFDG